jgi:large exoprotein involved in heme utilization and adhesion
MPLALIDQNFCAATAGTGSSFTIVGRGGLPPSPNSTLNSDTVWEDWRLTAVPHDHHACAARDFQPTVTPKRTTSEPIIEATGWVKNDLGEVFLTANPPTLTLHSPWFKSASSHT